LITKETKITKKFDVNNISLEVTAIFAFFGDFVLSVVRKPEAPARG
jgi:hypothetical protein